MKIALFHNLPSGGAKRVTLEQVRELARRGHEIVEFAPTTADLDYCSVAPFIRRRHVFAAKPVRMTQRRIPFVTPYVHALQGIATLRRTQQLNQAIAREIDAGGFEIVLVKDCHIAANPYVLRYLDTPSVFDCEHGLRHRVERTKANHPAHPNSSALERLRSMYYRPARKLFDSKLYADEGQNVECASLVLVGSEFSRQLFSECYTTTPHVAYPGINTEIFRPQPTDKKNYGLCVGSLIYSKGYRFLVSALARIDARRRPGLFVAANSIDPDERKAVEEMAIRGGVELHIEQIFDDRRLVEVYSQARVFVYAPIQEPLGLSPLESMACGTPVVAVAEGGVCETVPHGVAGWLVDRDANAFAEKLEALLNDDATRTSMGQAGIDYIRQCWNWHDAADRLEHELWSVVE